MGDLAACSNVFLRAMLELELAECLGNSGLGVVRPRRTAEKPVLCWEGDSDPHM